MTDFPPSFPRIKLHRPRVATGWIPRLRLMERLDQVLHKPVALISAPAGFGKTTLLAQIAAPLRNARLMAKQDYQVSVNISRCRAT